MDRYSYRNRSHLADLTMNGCHETWRPLLNSMYHFSYVWGIAFAMGFGGRLILRWIKSTVVFSVLSRPVRPSSE